MRLKAIAFLIFICVSSSSFAQKLDHPLVTEDFEAQKRWVDSTYNALSLNEKVGQLFMVQVFSNMDAKHEIEI